MVIDEIKGNVLFNGLNEEEIQTCLACSNAKVKTYDKNQLVFSQMEPPKSLYLLLNGSVTVCRDTFDGKKHIVTTIEERGIFGEVYVFLEKEDYSYYVIVNAESRILEIPKEFFFSTCSESCRAHSVIIQNMLGILAGKAYYLNNKLQLLTSGSLRQRISKYLIENCQNNKYVKLPMNREQLSAYLNVARPSLSRELTRMQEEELIEVDRDMVKILDFNGLNACIK